MTFLDDYKAAYKLKGVRLVSNMLDNVPSDLIKRTGVGKLISTVCKMRPAIASIS